MRMWIALVSVALLAACSAASPDALPFYDSPELTPRWSGSSMHRIGEFALVSQTGATFTDRDLRGRIHVATFLYTRCAGICPQIVQRLMKVQQAIRLMPDVKLVSFSVTPDVDTPADLAAFGEARNIDPRRWLLLTGDARLVHRLARESYFADDGRLQQQGAPDSTFLHTEKALLVDKDGRLRGVYNATHAFDVEHLLADIERLR